MLTWETLVVMESKPVVVIARGLIYPLPNKVMVGLELCLSLLLLEKALVLVMQEAILVTSTSLATS